MLGEGQLYVQNLFRKKYLFSKTCWRNSLQSTSSCPCRAAVQSPLKQKMGTSSGAGTYWTKTTSLCQRWNNLIISNLEPTHVIKWICRHKISFATNLFIIDPEINKQIVLNNLQYSYTNMSNYIGIQENSLKVMRSYHDGWWLLCLYWKYYCVVNCYAYNLFFKSICRKTPSFPLLSF